MSDEWAPEKVATLAAEIDARIQALPARNSPNVRTVRREYTKQLKNVPADFVLALATMLLHAYAYRGTGSIAYELISYHSPAFVSLDITKIEGLGQGIDSWHSVDGFARLISGPAWLKGLISDEVIHRWARSHDLWWRRAALVSTVALNMRSHGGYGDVDRTLAVCRMLVDDHEDMVVKALSWALRQLVVHDPEAVRGFLSKHEERLAARIKREVLNKLETGLKNPRRSIQ
jgi:3-methyladenine DNA glycosylase AlkD